MENYINCFAGIPDMNVTTFSCSLSSPHLCHQITCDLQTSLSFFRIRHHIWCSKITVFAFPYNLHFSRRNTNICKRVRVTAMTRIL